LLVIHGDILTDIDLAGFIRFHKQEGRMATIAVKPREAERRYGKVMLEGNRITQFLDSEQSEGISIVNTGVYLLQPETLRLIREGEPAYFERDLFPRLADIDELSAFIFQGVWFDISQERSYSLAKKRWKKRE
jgi:NDP-sugar pyrophosphorylase family protein